MKIAHVHARAGRALLFRCFREIIYIMQLDHATCSHSNQRWNGFAVISKCIMSGCRVVYRGERERSARFRKIGERLLLCDCWISDDENTQNQNGNSHTMNLKMILWLWNRPLNQHSRPACRNIRDAEASCCDPILHRWLRSTGQRLP